MKHEKSLSPVVCAGRNKSISEIRPVSGTGDVCENYTLCNKIDGILHEIT